MKTFLIAFMLIGVLLDSCGTPVPTAAPPKPTDVPHGPPTVVTSTGYRPLQINDVVEGQPIGYQYLVPTPDQPAVDIAFGINLLQLNSLKPELTSDLVSYIKDLGKYKDVLGFDENDPNQKDPKPITWDPSKPVEIVYIYIDDFTTQRWSVQEGANNEIYAAYKIVRRKDGGLRFIDAYGQVALNSSANTMTLNGGGGGLMFSSRLALLRLILSDSKYQRGVNVMVSYPPATKDYDSRILKIDPTQTGLSMDKDWVIVSHPGPTGGQTAP